MIATLKNDKFTAQVDTFGAQLISLKDKNNTEFIWQRDPKFWDECAPILFPIVGRAVDGIITIDGKDFEMGLHGFACESAFEVVSQSDTLLVLMMKSTDVTKKSYPYDFEFYVTYVLDEQGLDTQLKVVNTDEREMVFGIGGHPAISWPIFEGDTYDDYVIDFGSITELEALTCNEDAYILADAPYKIKLDGGKLPLKHALFNPDAIIVEKADFDKIHFVNKENKGVEFSFKNFKSFAMWTMIEPDYAPFICFEPWNSMGKKLGESTVLKEKKDVITLDKGNAYTCSYKISVLA